METRISSALDSYTLLSNTECVVPLKEVAFASPWWQGEELIKSNLKGGHQKKRKRASDIIPAPQHPSPSPMSLPPIL